MAEPPRTPQPRQRREGDEYGDGAEGVEMKKVAGRVRADALDTIGQLVDRHPQEVANVLRRWMNNG
ncbi:hypothetical protein SAMN05216241_101482 [Limimonas halophila]|uniref:Flagellar M-ring protein FliF n=1 Tax=Limimonas halophila TaxID=1082479 RepID=A0A1G7M6A8_9PROT|nr:hypothetical protein [Limimonas halophila]SDF56740.1 hypothetical protein SAMN05216241_101482 [Limimonas halophila]